MHDLLVHSAGKFPGKEALFAGDKAMLFSEVAEESGKLACALSELGTGRGDRVALFLEKRFEEVVSIFGTSMAGGCVVPVRRLLHGRQVGYILSNSGARVLITTYSRLAGLAEWVRDLPDLRIIIALGEKTETGRLGMDGIRVVDWKDLLAGLGTAPPSGRPVVETDLAAILYTSGSTGNPEGVVLNHANIFTGAKCVSECLKITERDKLLSIITFSFDVGLNQLTGAFLHGAQVVLLDVLFPKQIPEAVQRHGITGLGSIAAVWLQLLQIPWPKMPTLRYLTNTGGTIPENYVRELRRRLPMRDIYLMYGLTEAFRSTYLDPSLVDSRPTSIGKAIPGEEIMVLDENDEPVGPGEVGELVHRGPLVAQG